MWGFYTKGQTKQKSSFLSPCALPQSRALAFLMLWNDIQLQPKLLDQLEFCRAVFYSTTFSHRRMNLCPFASLSHHTLCMRNLVWLTVCTCITYGWPQINVSPHRFWSWPMTSNRRLFLFGLKPIKIISLKGFLFEKVLNYKSWSTDLFFWSLFHF